jgi:ribosomal protein S18 acetylase RimI-like enzyme
MIRPAAAAESEIMGLGPAGPVLRTVMVDNVAIIGVRATKTLPRIAVHYIWISPSTRGHGHGNRVLDQVLRIADAHDVEVQLRPACFDRVHFGVRTGLDTRSLIAWYERKGFVRQARRPVQLLRPRSGQLLLRNGALG